MDILLKTITGSRLYGLAHDDSDYDYLTVVPGKRKTVQTIVGNQDNRIMSFGTFVLEARNGAPAALEAMFSEKAEIDYITEFRRAFRAGTNYDAYRGIMKRISKTPKWDDEKHRRLVIRLGLNLGELRMKNRFHPTLTMVESESIIHLAKYYDMPWCYDLALDLAGLR